MYCHDAERGKEKWKYFCGNTTQVATGAWVPWGPRTIADGKIYFATGEHSPPNPLPRGNRLICLDAYTGDELWSYPFMAGQSQGGGGISSGIYYDRSIYDGYLYGFGKGKSATTVSVSPSTIAYGSSVLIGGTVTDQSPGAPDTPAIGDSYQSEWMEYLYNNAPAPENVDGVPVRLFAMKSDGSQVDIGQVTSDMMGHFDTYGLRQQKTRTRSSPP